MHDPALRREILRLAVPAALQHLLQGAIVFLVDTKMIGMLAERQGSPIPLAAIGFASPVLWTLITIFSVLSIGTTAVVARAIGAGDPDRARRGVTTSLLTVAGLGVLLTLLAGGIADLAVDLYDPERIPVEGRELARDYLRLFLTGSVLHVTIPVAAAALRGAGDALSPFRAALVANAVNVVANAILIFGWGPVPAFGTLGAAAGTVIAHGVEVLLLLSILRGKSPFLSLAGRDWGRFDPALLRSMVRVSLPSLAEAFLFHSAFLVYQKAIFSLDSVSIAAQRIAIAVESMGFMTAWGFHIAAGTLAGRELGRGDPDRAHRAVGGTTRIAVVCIGLVSLLCWTLPGPMVRFFADLPEVAAEAHGVLWMAGIEVLLIAVCMPLSGGMRGAGGTGWPMLATWISAWGARAPLAFVLGLETIPIVGWPGLGWGLTGIWIATLLDWGIRAALLYRFYRGRRWLTARAA